MTNKFAAAAAAAVANGADQTQAKTGGGDGPILPNEGPCNLRLVAYIELGKHEKAFQGKPKRVDLVALTVELSGKNHPPIDTDNGPMPHRITFTETLSQNEKARFFKLFGLLNYAGTAKHCSELLGNAYRGRVIHREYTGRDGKVRKVAELYDKKLGMYTISPPRVEIVDEDGQPTGEYRTITVAPALSDIRCFIWDSPVQLKEMWDSLFIEGEYPERKDEKTGEVIAPAKSKNQFQLKIASALNYKGSAIQMLLANGGEELDLPADGVVDEESPADDEPEAPAAPAKPAAKPAAKAAGKKGDPLAGVA